MKPDELLKDVHLILHQMASYPEVLAEHLTPEQHQRMDALVKDLSDDINASGDDAKACINAAFDFLREIVEKDFFLHLFCSGEEADELKARTISPDYPFSDEDYSELKDIILNSIREYEASTKTEEEKQDESRKDDNQSSDT